MSRRSAPRRLEPIEQEPVARRQLQRALVGDDRAVGLVEALEHAAAGAVERRLVAVGPLRLVELGERSLRVARALQRVRAVDTRGRVERRSSIARSRATAASAGRPAVTSRSASRR